MTLIEQQDKYIRKQLGRCGKCKYVNFNYTYNSTLISRYSESNCRVKETDTHIMSFISKMRCKYFEEFKIDNTIK